MSAVSQRSSSRHRGRHPASAARWRCTAAHFGRMSDMRALMARLEGLQRTVEAAAVSADRDAAAREQMLRDSRQDVETRCLGSLRELLSQHETEISVTAAEISAACVAREVAAVLPRLREMARTDRRITHETATDGTRAEINDLRRTIEALQAQLDSQRKQADEAHTQYEAAMATQSSEHRQTVQHLEDQLEAERSRARLDRQTDADVFAKQALRAETRAAHAERRAEKAEAKLKQLELAAREWTGRVRTASSR